MSGMRITLQNVDHWFSKGAETGHVRVLEDINLEVKAGEFVAIVGPSGCGKTTALNMVAGLVEPTTGAVSVGDSPPKVGHPDIGYLFARDCLLPWRTAAKNVELPLEIRNSDRTSLRNKRSEELLEAVGLARFSNSYPSQLSQGMRQRVALARTLAPEPNTLLMDEPFSALDAQTRLTLHELFLSLWERHHSTVLFITHDLAEAIALADRVVVFSKRPGRIKADFDVDLPRPRNVADLQGSDEYHSLYRRIWEVLEEEMIAKDEELEPRVGAGT